MSDADDMASWKALLARVEELQKAEDELRKQHYEAFKAWADKVAEARAASDAEFPRLTSEVVALLPAISESGAKLASAEAATRAALEAAEAARPLSSQQLDFDTKLELARRGGRAPQEGGSGTPQ